MTRFLVYRGRALLYRPAGAPPWAPYGLAAGDLPDGVYDARFGVVAPRDHEIRPATMDDFRRLRVSPLPLRVTADGVAYWAEGDASTAAA